MLKNYDKMTKSLIQSVIESKWSYFEKIKILYKLKGKFKILRKNL